MAFAAQWHTPHNRCVRFAPAVAGDHATLATGRPLRPTRTGLSPAGPRQLSWRTSNPWPQIKLDCFVAYAPRKKVAQKRCHTTNIEPQTFIQGGSVPYPPVPTRNDEEFRIRLYPRDAKRPS